MEIGYYIIYSSIHYEKNINKTCIYFYYVFITQQLFLEAYLLHARLCFRHWKYSSEQDKELALLELTFWSGNQTINISDNYKFYKVK